MKTSIRILAALLALLLLALPLVACGDPTGTPEESGTESTAGETESTADGTASTEEGTSAPEKDPTKTTYTVSIQTVGGRPIKDLTFRIYEGDSDDLVEFGETDENGIGTVELKPSDNYTVQLPADKLEGYNVEGRYSFTGTSLAITLTSSVIADDDLTGVRYELGDVMRDFTVTTSDGETFKLSEVLKTKKAVMINFWYSTCGPCVNEFPYLQSAYEKYKDSIEVIGLNNYAGDDLASVQNFKASMGLTFPMAKDYSALGTAFSLAGYPTSIFIDRFGTICLIEVGGLTSEKPFTAAFSHFAAADYTQRIIETMDELTPIELPDKSMPSSEEIGAVINGTGFSATYAPETESADAEYSWPFVIGEKNGVPCILASNAKKDASFATMHVTVDLKAGDALAFDWFGETELGVDVLYVLVNDKDIYRLSGVSTDWETRYPYIALEDGTYRISFVYLKDDSTDVGADTVYLRNFRIVAKENVNVDTYIPRDAATNPNASGIYQSYVTAVYNPADGFYHAHTADGPLLLADLMGSTKLSETSLNLLGYDGELVHNGKNLYDALIDYCNHAINGTIYGLSPVTEELKGILEEAAALVGFDTGNPNQWLLPCSYYDAYGQNVKQLDSPVKGIAPFDPFEAIESAGETLTYNTVTYDGRVIMPRGFLYRFIPERSGAYIIQSQSEHEVNGWIFDADRNQLQEAAIVDRPWNVTEIDTTNVTMIQYLEAGKTYFIDIAYYDIYAAGTFTFTLQYLGESYKHFHLASPGYFTYTESTTGQLNETVAGGIDVALGDDGFYHEKLADGSLGSIVYADFTIATGLFSHSIEDMIALGGFDFSRNEYDDIVLKRLDLLDGDKDACRAYFREEWGEQYDYFADLYKLEEILAGSTHGEGENLTEAINAYLAKKLPATEEAPELAGCVPVDAELAEILQALIDKFSFEGVDHAWTKLCYYYKHVGA